MDPQPRARLGLGAAMRLSPRDLDQLQHAILDLHDLPELESFRQAVPGLFLRMIPADWIMLIDAEANMRARCINVLDCWESSPVLNPDLVCRMERVAFDHPFSRYSLFTGDLTALKFSDFFSVAQLDRSELYNEFYRHADGGRFLATAIYNPRGFSTINAARSIRSRDFTERDRLVMNMLSPHFEAARRAAERNTARGASPVRPLADYGLTAREQEVATWLARGKTNAEIGAILEMHARTAEKHVERILAKLSVDNRTAAAVVITRAPRR